MKKDRSLKQRLLAAILTMVMLTSSFLGTTFAWFTDEVTSEGNTIQSGSLKIDLSHKVGDQWVSLKQNPDHKVFDYAKWEPGYTQVASLKIDNLGSLAMKFRLSIAVGHGTATLGENGENLADVIDVYITDGEKMAASFDAAKAEWERKGTLYEVMMNPSAFFSGKLLPAGKTDATEAVGSQTVTIALHMQESAGNGYQNLSAGDIYVDLIATQMGYENDSFGSDYDDAVTFPDFDGITLTADVSGKVDAENKLTEDVILTNGQSTMGLTRDTVLQALVQKGTQLKPGTTKLIMTISEMETTGSNIVLGEGEDMRSLDVHLNGVAAENETPILVSLPEIAPTGLNLGNYQFYHVEGNVTKEMTKVDAPAKHNEFSYDPATGDVVLAMATFSEVALVAEPAKWNGEIATGFNGGLGTENDPYIIANADQLAYLSAVVGGMTGLSATSFKDKYIKLITDIDLNDAEEGNNNFIFYPIGYYNSEGTYERTNTAITSGLRNFEGTFDGNGHTIANFYHNTWEMKGDHNWYSPEEQYYRDGMGLFGRVYKGTIKNLTVRNFSSDGEIATTGVIAAYADGATFENIAIFNCNPRVYNIGNGGIVGCVGWYAKEADMKTTFKNITVDNSNKISALWGSYDVACGGIVGQYYPTSGQTSAGTPKNGGVEFTNCHISAQMDVYNDVCANYQYYAYRYTGMLIGSVRENVTIDGHVYPKMDGIEAKDCTVHFGDWNDYYYCELVANSLASYTHDHQMSRLEQVASVDVENMKVISLDGKTTDIPTSGRVNYVVVKAKDANGMWIHGDGKNYATCYHFVDGNVWNHEDAGTETVNGVEGVLKEDKQLIYREFNQLFTGYGWGVTSKGLTDFEGVENMDITEGREESVEKFKSEVTELANNKTYTFAEIFSFVNNGVELVPGALAMSVTNLEENNPVSATIEYDRDNWENGTITLTGTGKVKITIQDYYFCTPTTIEVTITDRQPEVKFDVVMNNGDFLHRVGNSGTVPLDRLFKAKDGVKVGTISVTVEAVNGTSASGTYSNNAIQFSGTGVVKVTITDNDYCTPTELLLEVVDAVNATGAMSATSNNVVLLNNAGFSSLEVSGGYTLFGNGFTLTCGSDSAALDMGYAFVTLNNGTLDNVQIVCPNFDYAVLYKSNMTESGNRKETTDKTRYYNVKSGVMVSGNSQILNSRVSGARAAVNVTGGNLIIDNSRLEGGAVATLLVGAANSLKLKDVTLVQKPTASTHDANKTIMGMSVLYLCDTDGNATATTLEGSLVQYAWADSSCTGYMPSGTSSIADNVLKKTNYTHTVNGKTCVNLGFAYMPNEGTTVKQPGNITDNRTNSAAVPYAYEEVKASVPVSGVSVAITTYVYSYKNDKGTADNFMTESTYVPNKYGDIITVSYSDSADGIAMGKSFGTDGWVYELNVDLDKLSGYKLDFSKLSMSVNGVPVVDFKVNGDAKPTSPVAVTAGGVSYVLTATVSGKECAVTLIVTGVETSKRAPYLVDKNGNEIAVDGVAWVAHLNLKGKSGTTTVYGGAVPVLEGVYIRYWSVSQSKDVTVLLSDLTPDSEGKVNGTNRYWEYTDPDGDFTLKIEHTENPYHSSKSIYGMPVVYNRKLYFVPASSNGLVSSNSGARTPTFKYTFTDNNGGALEFKHTWKLTIDDKNTVDYTTVCGESSSGSTGTCLAAGTMITMADGSKKAVEDIQLGEMVMSFDHMTGKVVYREVIWTIATPGEFFVNSFVFDDGTKLVTINEHGIFDLDLNKYVNIDQNNYHDYLGHRFVSIDSEGNIGIKILVDVVAKWDSGYKYDIITDKTFNYVAEDLLSVTHTLVAGSNTFDFGDNLTIDQEKMQADIEKYGLYTYEEWEPYCDYETFVKYQMPIYKVGVAKGLYTEEFILEVFETYLYNESALVQ